MDDMMKSDDEGSIWLYATRAECRSVGASDDRAGRDGRCCRRERILNQVRRRRATKAVREMVRSPQSWKLMLERHRVSSGLVGVGCCENQMTGRGTSGGNAMVGGVATTLQGIQGWKMRTGWRSQGMEKCVNVRTTMMQRQLFRLNDDTNWDTAALLGRW